jgi:outer membrane lipoprotein SlyB
MKKLIVIVLASATLALAGCGNQGGSSDQYNTTTGAASSTNHNWDTITNDYQGGALSPGYTNDGVGASTNYQGLDTNSVPEN